MAESYSTSLRLTLIGDGDLSGTWGDVTNSNLGTLLEQAITGFVSIVMTDQNYTLKSYNGVTDEARAAVIVATGTNTTTRQIIAPLVPKLYIVNNQTTGGYSITIGGSTGSVVTVPNGQSALVYCDGTSFYNGITVAASAATTIGGGSANQILYQASGSNTQFITAPSTAGSYLEWTGTGFTWNTPSAALAVGSSPISGGNYGYVLYNNGGILGNAPVSGTGLTLVTNNAPTISGANLGTPSAINLANATGLTSTQVTTALTYTPYNGTTNPNNYITSSSPTIYTPNITGVTNGSTASAGYVGQVITATSSSTPISVTPNVDTVMCQLTLTPGDWDVTSIGSAYASVGNYYSDFITSNNSSPSINSSSGFYGAAEFSACTFNYFQNYNVTTNTTVYCLVRIAGGTSAGFSGTGAIFARRMR